MGVWWCVCECFIYRITGLLRIVILKIIIVNDVRDNES